MPTLLVTACLPSTRSSTLNWLRNFETPEELQAFLAGIGLHIIEITMSALFLAGQAHKRYRQNGGERKRMLADFLIGAQAQVTGRPILTRDPGAYRTYFPTCG